VGICDYLTRVKCLKVKRAVFLDRDGVINRALVRDRKPYPPKNILELEILPGVVEALESLSDAGWVLVVVTNQPDVTRGVTNLVDVEKINNYIKRILPIHEFRTCYHDDHDGCSCRKPNPGALYAAAHVHNINLKSSYMIGDRWRDIEAGERAGCETIFIDYGYDEKQPKHFDHRVCSLAEAAKIILGDGHGIFRTSKS
jgi:D-glycero-D-manno-heptose 1,7-bisphosphate phosphatase